MIRSAHYRIARTVIALVYTSNFTPSDVLAGFLDRQPGLCTVLTPNNVTGGGLITVGLCVNILISGVSSDRGRGGRHGATVGFTIGGVHNDTIGPCEELVGVVMEACMVGSGIWTNVVDFDVADPRLRKLLRLEPDQCFLCCRGALSKGRALRLARQGRANMQASIAASATWHCVAMTYGKFAVGL